MPINSLGNNAGEHNGSIVPIKCIDGQLGSGRLIDFALTSGRPAGPWHAYRLMSPFTCKFKEIMGSSPCKFTQKRRRHPQYGRGSSRRDWRSSKSSCTFILGVTRPVEFSFMSVVLKLSFIVITEQKNMIEAPPVSSTGHLNDYSARSAAKTHRSVTYFSCTCHPSLTFRVQLRNILFR